MDADFKRLELECTNCHLKFYAHQLKVDPESNLLVCANCYRYPRSQITVLKDVPLKKKEKIPAFPSAPPKPEPPKALPKKEAELNIELPPGYVLFKCQRCDYLFRRKAGWKDNCPYCNKEGTLKVLKRA